MNVNVSVLERVVNASVLTFDTGSGPGRSPTIALNGPIGCVNEWSSSVTPGYACRPGQAPAGDVGRRWPTPPGASALVGTAQVGHEATTGIFVVPAGCAGGGDRQLCRHSTKSGGGGIGSCRHGRVQAGFPAVLEPRRRVGLESEIGEDSTGCGSDDFCFWCRSPDRPSPARS